MAQVKLKPILVSGFAFGLFATILGMFLFYLWQFFFPNYAEFYLTQAFRPLDHPATILLFILPFFEGIIFAFFYGSIKSAISCNTPFERGTTYGLFLFFVSALPYLLLIFSLFNVPATLVSLWVIEMLARNFLGCGLLAVVFEKMPESSPAKK